MDPVGPFGGARRYLPMDLSVARPQDLGVALPDIPGGSEETALNTGQSITIYTERKSSYLLLLNR